MSWSIKENINIDTLVEIYYKLINIDYDLNDNKYKALFETINKRIPEINTNYIYRHAYRYGNTQTYNYTSRFTYNTTFDKFERVINSLYNEVKPIIDNTALTDNERKQQIVSIVVSKRHRYIYRNYSWFLGADNTYDNSLIDNMYKEFVSLFHNILIYNNIINTKTTHCILRGHIHQLTTQINLLKASTPIDYHNIYKLKAHIDNTIDKINKLTHDVNTLQTILNDLYCLHIYKDIFSNSEVFDKLFTVSIYLK